MVGLRLLISIAEVDSHALLGISAPGISDRNQSVPGHFCCFYRKPLWGEDHLELTID
jgi:hypothetical protein